MSSHRPDRDALTAFLEGALSIDARQWMEHHLKGCEACRHALESERAFLERLSKIACIEPPSDFVSGVMARVAQQPAHSPAAKIPWRRVVVWGGSAAAAVLVTFGIGAWAAVNAGMVGESDTSGLLYQLILAAVQAVNFVLTYGSAALDQVWTLVGGIGAVVLQLFRFAENAGWKVQLAVLLVTVSLNYILTRMVLNYQRRQ